MQEMLSGIATVAVTCLQWGDTGKGKIVDHLATWADIIARGTGGANSGHTIVTNQGTAIFHLIPCGILYDAQGKVNIIGSGVAVDPRVIEEELQMLKERNLSCNHLQISPNAKLTLPTHILRDRLSESNADAGKIGTTGRGIGPTFEDHTGRRGLTINDLRNKNILRAKVWDNVSFTRRIAKSYDCELVKQILCHHHLGGGVFYHPEKMFDVDAIVDQYAAYGRILKPFIRDTDGFVQANLGSKKLLLEGAQGALLDVDYGTRPFVTSSACMVDGLAKGVGLNRSHIDLSLGVFKGFYQTRVGEGPFPTELGGEQSAQWCRKTTREQEAMDCASVDVNCLTEFLQGIGIRKAGNEYGATTGRPRRTGWLDLPLLRHALRWNSKDVVLTKLDVLNDCAVIKVCTHYYYMGPSYYLGDRRLKKGDPLFVAIPAAEVLEWCKPVWREFPGWKQSLKGASSLEDLPEPLRAILNFVVAETGVRPRMISIGPDREETLFV